MSLKQAPFKLIQHFYSSYFQDAVFKLYYNFQVSTVWHIPITI